MAVETYHTECISLKVLFEKEILKEGFETKGSITWESGNSIRIDTLFSSIEQGVRLRYFTQDRNIDYWVGFMAKPSNLGRGKIYYFVCPTTKTLCRRLYLAPGSIYFQSYKAYLEEGKRIYYYSQLVPKGMRYYHYLFRLSEKGEKVFSKFGRSHYKGKPTKRYTAYLKYADKNFSYS